MNVHKLMARENVRADEVLFYVRMTVIRNAAYFSHLTWGDFNFVEFHET
jgi:hypothetical protein